MLGRARVLPVLRSDSAASARAQVDALVGAGLPAIELTRSTPGWAEALAGVRLAHPQLCLGLGTVRDADDVRRAHDLEVDFLVSPWPAPAVRAAADELGVPLVEGGFTPGELAAAAAHGPAKLFPAAPVGPGYLRALLPVLPGARVLPTGGSGSTRSPRGSTPAPTPSGSGATCSARSWPIPPVPPSGWATWSGAPGEQ